MSGLYCENDGAGYGIKVLKTPPLFLLPSWLRTCLCLVHCLRGCETAFAV